MSPVQANRDVCLGISPARKYFACLRSQLERGFLKGPEWLAALLIVAVALVGLNPSVRASEPKWPPGQYKYLVIDQDIKEVLTEFGRNIDVPVEVSDQVKGRLRGQLPVATAREFLNQLCESYGLVWYFDGAALHINAKSEIKTELINIGRLPVKNVTDELDKLGIADPRFPVRTTADGAVISVSGPTPFIALVRQTLTAMARAASPVVREEKSGDEIRVRVFRGNTSALPEPVTALPMPG
jgi:type II secretory pathway component GspD/PulD (secretin)